MSTSTRSSLADLAAPLDRYPLAREAALAALVFGALQAAVVVSSAVGVPVARGLVDLGSPLAATGAGQLAVSALANTVVIVGGPTLAAAAYVHVRDLPVPLSLPGRGRADLALVAAALAGPALALAIAALLGDLTGTPFYELSGSRSAPDAGVRVPTVITLLGLALTLPAYLLVAHVVVQPTLRTVSGEATAAGLTTLFVGLLGPTALTRPGPLRAFAFPALLAIAVVLPACAAYWYDRQWLTAVVAVPLTLVLAGGVHDLLVDVAGPAGALYAGGEVLVVAIGAAGVARTDSVVPAALAFTSYTVGAAALSYLTSVGMPI
ncbi:hypothetical protein [Halomicrobium salinisoli]|uniref:hypothetical protein n=1 Tax=Halomicrobium salinisoli TaxID=2878391 RepID=UPI001CF079ED|nr:hypothetical protein [Halomicrobium salinisoli]